MSGPVMSETLATVQTMTSTAQQKVTRVVRFNLDEAALSEQQQALLERHAGTARVVWNWALAAINTHEDLVRSPQMRGMPSKAGLSSYLED